MSTEIFVLPVTALSLIVGPRGMIVMRPVSLICSFSVVFVAICSEQVNRHSGVGDQRLIAAIKRNDARAVKTLLAAGADPNTHEHHS